MGAYSYEKLEPDDMSDRQRLTSLLDRLLEEYNHLLDAMHAGRAEQGTPRRLLKINAEIHAAYRRLSFLGPVESSIRSNRLRDLEELLA